MRFTTIIATFLWLSLTSICSAGWYYSSYPRAGYTWYNGGYYGTNHYYQQGYYYYDPPQVRIAAFVYPVYAAQYTTYQQVATAPVQQVYQTSLLAPVQTLVPVATTTITPAQIVTTQQVQQTTNQAGADRLAALEKSVAEIKLMLQGRAVQPQALPAQHPGLAAMVSKCATCHDKTTSKQGGDHVFFDNGAFLVEDAATLNSFYRKLLRGEMPPKNSPQLTQEESPKIAEYLSNIKGK